MIISVQTAVGSDALKLTVESFDSITRVKQIIYRKQGTPPETQSLSFDGKELEDGRTINFYNITSESTLRMMVLPPGPFPNQWTKEITVGGALILKGPSRMIGKAETPGKFIKADIPKCPIVPCNSSIIITFCTPEEAQDPSETPSEVLGVSVRAFTSDNLIIKCNGTAISTRCIPLPPYQVGICPDVPFLEDTVYEIYLDATSSQGHFFNLRENITHRLTSYNLGNEGCSSFRRLGVWTFKTESSNNNNNNGSNNNLLDKPTTDRVEI